MSASIRFSILQNNKNYMIKTVSATGSGIQCLLTSKSGPRIPEQFFPDPGSRIQPIFSESLVENFFELLKVWWHVATLLIYFYINREVIPYLYILPYSPCCTASQCATFCATPHPILSHTGIFKSGPG